MEITLKNSVIFTLLVILGVVIADGGLKISRRMRFMNGNPNGGNGSGYTQVYRTTGAVTVAQPATQPTQPVQAAQTASAPTAGVVLSSDTSYGG